MAVGWMAISVEESRLYISYRNVLHCIAFTIKIYFYFCFNFFPLSEVGSILCTLLLNSNPPRMTICATKREAELRVVDGNVAHPYSIIVHKTILVNQTTFIFQSSHEG
jgi:hypothetical protein